MAFMKVEFKKNIILILSKISSPTHEYIRHLFKVAQYFVHFEALDRALPDGVGFRTISPW
jgi:hypothetical protein